MGCKGEIIVGFLLYFSTFKKVEQNYLGKNEKYLGKNEKYCCFALLF